MTERERAERAAFYAELRARIASGEITAEEAESEWDFHFNGMDSRGNLGGW